MKLLRKVGAFLAMLGIAGKALAENDAGGPSGEGSVWTVHAFSNAQAIYDAFNAVANVAASPFFASMLSFISVTGIIAVVLTGGFQPGGSKKVIGYLASVIIMSYLFTGYGSGGVTVKVEIIDSVTGVWKSPISVPIVLGVPAAVISTAGAELTAAIEQSFTSMPDELKISNGAPFNLAAALLSDATKAKITDANLANSLAYYIQDCFTTGVGAGALNARDLLNSTNFLSDIQYDNKALMVHTSLPAAASDTKTVTGTLDGNSAVTYTGPMANELVNCTEAYTRIAARIGNGDAAEYLSSASAWASTPALSVLNSAADAVALAAGGPASSGGAMVKQAAVIAAFSGAQTSVAANTGNSEFLSALSLKQAETSRFNSWIIGAELFNRIMGYIYAVLQVFVYCLAPLVFMAMLIPGVGGALAKSFIQVLVWMALWQPLLGIVNFVVLSLQSSELGGIMNATGEFGMTMTTMGLVSEKTSNLRAAASFIGTMVPLLAWGMVKGSIDMSKYVASASGEQFNSVAANTMTTGNYSLNQASMDSFTANKNSIAQTSAPGGGYSVTDGTSNYKYDLGGATSVINGEAAKVATTASNTTGTTAAIGNTTATTNGVQNVVAAGDTVANNKTGTHGDSGTRTNSAGTTDSKVFSGGGNANASGSANKPMRPEANTPPPTGSIAGIMADVAGAPPAKPSAAAPGQTPTLKQETTGDKLRNVGKGALRVGNAVTPTVGANAQGGVNLSAAAIKANQTTVGQNAALTNSGTVGQQASNLDSATQATTDTRQASLQDQAGRTLTQNATPVANSQQRGQAFAQPIMQAERESLFGRDSFMPAEGSALYKAFYSTGGGDSDAMNRADAATVNPNSVAQQQEKILADVKNTQKGDKDDIKDRTQNTKNKYEKVENAAENTVGAAERNLAGFRKGAQASAFESKYPEQRAEDAVEYLKDKGGAVLDAAGAATQNAAENYRNNVQNPQINAVQLPQMKSIPGSIGAGFGFK